MNGNDLCVCWTGPCVVHSGHCCFRPDAHERTDEHILRGLELLKAGDL